MVKKKGKKNSKRSGGSNGRPSSNLTIHFMPWSEIAHEDITGRIKKILGLVLQEKIIILQGKLKPEEESRLIEDTMALIGNVKDFQGIEIAAISNESQRSVFEKVRHNIVKILVGEQDTITIIGPAKIVKEIKKDPKKIELMLKNRR
jgi:hypothetical protein